MISKKYSEPNTWDKIVPTQLENDVTHAGKETAALDPSTLNNRGKKNVKHIIKASTILAATAMVHFLSIGFASSIGVYHVEFLRVFNKSSGVTSWIGSINYAALCGAGPIASYLIKKTDCGKTMIIGGVISSLGIFSCVYAQNIYMLFISFGLITGIGFGLSFSASLSVVSLYFDKWRIFALGLSLCGSGLGRLVYPPLVTYLITVSGWRGSLLIINSLSIHVCLAGMIIGLITKEKNISLEYQDVEIKNMSLTKLSILETDETSNKHSIWMIPTYWTLHANCLLFCFGQSVVFTHIASFASSLGYTNTESSLLLSIFGLCSLIGVIGLGTVAQLSFINARMNALFILCYATAGIWTILYCLWHIYVSMVLNIALLGISMAAYGPLLTEVVCKTVGVHNFVDGYGFLMISQAIGTLLGAPSAGWLYDITKKYNSSFYLGGASLVLSGLIMTLPSIYQRIKETDYGYMKRNLMHKALQKSLRDISMHVSQPLVP